MSATRWRALRLIVGGAILAAVVLRLGSQPVLEGVQALTVPAVCVALIVTAVTTWCCARRWTLLAGRLGHPLAGGTAYPAYYRSQVVNATLPFGVVGDVDRAVRHGFSPVVWERGLGQLVQAALTVALLLLLPTRVGWTAGPVFLVMVGSVVLAALVARRQLRRLVDVALLCRVAFLSAGVVIGHLLVFLVAARTVGVDLPIDDLLPVAALVLLASAVPTNVAGWGPREGVAAWAFAQVGLGADAGLTVAVTFGLLSLLATLPGAMVLLAPAHRTRRRARELAGVGRG